ncbi:BspA family leucine-rich repeat surface protein [Helicobacter saguini]|uniref:BspA family leucine-rich repeat surface protein n=1 Tax=Helicobacter saguini TaxID=1548018 RepID=A0A347VVN3_9HELI|nr:BspA family leucine-rich repeat surface protein [Helicobacter saguini]MWV62354.1 BspA family leucine-rich repeat surface protein [Helicobacter saguini]MWV66975.1 BspA family leucine-rich repeat surface protein [Helicobacter saguini]MWV69323.1 BspA family leucine-rich repeat surface protein [Helicobacter saguini]MWV71122.1 BspA family leucine-rich repeat surface protein [Helicobacter saguini]TLD94984.1 BspA family leucine-rich repeat surface protein [Helicobacter saguini]
MKRVLVLCVAMFVACGDKDSKDVSPTQNTQSQNIESKHIESKKPRVIYVKPQGEYKYFPKSRNDLVYLLNKTHKVNGKKVFSIRLNEIDVSGVVDMSYLFADPSKCDERVTKDYKIDSIESNKADSIESNNNLSPAHRPTIETPNIESNNNLNIAHHPFKETDSIESKMQDSRFHNTQNSHSQILHKSIPTQPPIFKINAKPASANFDNDLLRTAYDFNKADSIKLANIESKDLSPTPTNKQTPTIDSKNLSPKIESNSKKCSYTASRRIKSETNILDSINNIESQINYYKERIADSKECRADKEKFIQKMQEIIDKTDGRGNCKYCNYYKTARSDLNHKAINELCNENLQTIESKITALQKQIEKIEKTLQKELYLLAAWDVSNVQDMSFMFLGQGINHISLNQWDTKSVRYMRGIFMWSNLRGERDDNNLATWDTGQVVDMSRAFSLSEFNGKISHFDTKNVRDMSDMFYINHSFNQPLNSWNVERVENMNSMFAFAHSFNQPLNSWNVANVKDMSEMFAYTHKFNQPLDKWNVANVKNMYSMFKDARKFNQPLNSWNVSKVKNMRYMFANASKFNQPLDKWNVSNVKNMNSMFYKASSFNQNIQSWDVSHVIDMGEMFAYASSFNQPLGAWNVANVRYMYDMFSMAEAFNQPLNAWNVSNVEYMGGMFSFATSFNQPLDKWNVSNVKDMMYMFSRASSFNQPLESWSVSRVQDMFRMFANAKSFNQNLESWDVSNVKNMEMMFENTAMQTLPKWYK